MNVAVYGATGRTGRAVAARLAGSGHEVVLCGRDGVALRRVSSGLPGPSRWRLARPGAMGELTSALTGVSAVVQCAALCLEDALAFVAAALDRRVAYIDVCADARIAAAIDDACSDSARRAGVPLLVGVAPIGGALGEWLGVEATRAAGAVDDAPGIEEIVLAYASDGLPRSAGSLRSGLRMLLDSAIGSNGYTRLEFPPPFGSVHAFGFPLGAGKLRHLFPHARVDVYASLCPSGLDSALPTALVLGAKAWAARLRNPDVVFEAVASRLSPGEGMREDGTAEGPTFAVVAQASSARKQASVAVVGCAPYRLTAAMVDMVLQQLAHRRIAGGAMCVSQLVPASVALDTLARTCDLRLFDADPNPGRGRHE